MKKELFKYMSMFQGISCDYDFVYYGLQPEPDYVMPDSELNRVLREIFSVDERTGLPKGDIAYYLSPDGNPSVKQWLENNLLKPRADRGENPSDLTDDLIVELSRGSDESIDSYQSRLMSIYDSAISEMNRINKSVNVES